MFRWGRMSRFWIVVATCALIGAALVPRASAPVSAAPSSSTATATPTATPDSGELADRLTNDIVNAQTDTDRTAAILNLMQTLHMEVITGQGDVLSKRAPNVPDGILLYDFDLAAMANAIGRSSYTDLDTTATAISQFLFKSSAPDTETLRQILIDGAQDSVQNPGDPMSLIPLVVRDLGLHHATPYDLAQDIPADKIQLDPLQQVLILVDLFMPYIKQQQAAASLTHNIRPHATVCSTDTVLQIVGTLMPAGKWGLSVTKLAAKGIEGAKAFKSVLDGVGSSLILVAEVEDLIQGMVLAGSIGTKLSQPDGQVTHFGPAGHTGDNGLGGKALRVQMQVFNYFHYPDYVIECGPIIGMKFPKYGGVPGVKVVWRTDNLEKLGTVAFQPADKTTDSNGLSTMTFTPKDEKVAGVGQLVTSKNSIQSVALYQTAFGNALGSIAQLVQFLQSKSYTDVSVERHAPSGFGFSGLKEAWDLDTITLGTVHLTGAFTGYVCGEDPYAKPWTLTENWGSNYSANQIAQIFGGQSGSGGWTVTEQEPAGPAGGVSIHLAPGHPEIEYLHGTLTASAAGAAGAQAQLALAPPDEIAVLFTPSTTQSQTAPLYDDRVHCQPPNPDDPGY